MPGLNKQGPLGAGPMTGRQRGMCRRTENLTLTGSAGRGRAMSDSLPPIGLPRGGTAQRRRRFAQSEAPAETGDLGGVDNELTELRKKFQELSAAIDRIAAKVDPHKARAS